MSAFLSNLRKQEKKLEEDGIATKSPPPKWWISTGSFLLNKIVSGRYRGGIAAQGRISGVTGPSSAGKSFIIANTIREAQAMGMGIFVLDSENALDDNFVGAIGVDTERDDYIYRGISSIPQATKIVSGFIKEYRSSGETQPFLIVLDSIDALRTGSQEEHYAKGDQKGDQGQHAKQVKDMLAPWMHDIKSLDIAILVSKQVFQEQDPMLAKNPQTAWKFTESTKYALSNILLVTRFMLKDENAKKIPGRSDTQYSGIRLKAYGMKTRFTKPFQSASIEVPYETGIDPYDGILAVAVSMGIVEQNGAWYSFNDTKFQSKNFDQYQADVLEALIAREKDFLEDTTEGEIIDATERPASASERRKERVREAMQSESESETE